MRRASRHLSSGPDRRGASNPTAGRRRTEPSSHRHRHGRGHRSNLRFWYPTPPGPEATVVRPAHAPPQTSTFPSDHSARPGERRETSAPSRASTPFPHGERGFERTMTSPTGAIPGHDSASSRLSIIRVQDLAAVQPPFGKERRSPLKVRLGRGESGSHRGRSAGFAPNFGRRSMTFVR